MRVVDAVEIETKGMDKLRTKLIDQFAKKDEAGNYVPNQGIKGTFVIPEENQEAYGRALGEFEALSFAMKWRKLPAEELADLRLAAAELKALDAVIHFTDD